MEATKSLIMVTIFSLTNRKAGLTATAVTPSSGAKAAGVVCTFLLGIHGGFFSGGYVSLLTAAFVAFFHFTFIEAVALTKVLNVFSSLVATLVFAREGLVDWRLGLVLGFASFAGGKLGAVLAKRVSNLWLRRIFVVAVVVMALKTLFHDVPWASLQLDHHEHAWLLRGRSFLVCSADRGSNDRAGLWKC